MTQLRHAWAAATSVAGVTVGCGMSFVAFSGRSRAAQPLPLRQIQREVFSPASVAAELLCVGTEGV